MINRLAVTIQDELFQECVGANMKKEKQLKKRDRLFRACPAFFICSFIN
jgi:membrane-anchored protein YejM (alkaline phosphatase superfamily)